MEDAIDSDEYHPGDLLRVDTWEGYIGQDKLKSRLGLHVRAALNTGRMVEHVLLEGPPGFGKTSIARIIAHELGADILELKMPVKPKVLAAELRQWDGGVLFLDEIHAASRREQELLLTLVEEGYLQLDNGRRIYVDELCVIGATTEPHKLIQPLRDRFPIKPRFVDYSQAEMAEIVGGMARKVDLEFADHELIALGKATGGTPRVGRDLILTARAMADDGETPTVEAVLDYTEMDNDGLSADHRAYLALVAELGGAGVGLKTITTILRLPDPTVRDLERLLVKQGLILFETNGRHLTNAGFAKAKGCKGAA